MKRRLDWGRVAGEVSEEPLGRACGWKEEAGGEDSFRSRMIRPCQECGRGGSGHREGRIKGNSTW